MEKYRKIHACSFGIVEGQDPNWKNVSKKVNLSVLLELSVWLSRMPRNGQRMSHISNKTNKSIKWKWDLKTTNLPECTSVIEQWYSKFEIVINNSTFQNSCSENVFSCVIFDKSLDLLGGAFKCSKRISKGLKQLGCNFLVPAV